MITINNKLCSDIELLTKNYNELQQINKKLQENYEIKIQNFYECYRWLPKLISADIL